MLSEEEKKAIWYLGEILVDGNDMKQWEIIENLIEKQNKIIDKMAGNVFLMNGDRGCTKQEIIEYFTKLVEEEN